MQALRLSEKAKAGIRRKHTTAAAFLDLSLAFDKIPHDALIYKMRKTNINKNIRKIIASYLKNRKFTVIVENETSTERSVRGGVPQGSALGPTLFNIYTNDIPTSRDPRIFTGMYADDTAIAATSKHTDHAIDMLQTELDKTTKYMIDWGLTINADKTQAILFTNKHHRENTKQIKTENIITKWQKDIVYLGIKLDQKLKFTQHIKETTARAARTQHLLKPLMDNLPEIEAGKLYKIFIRPITEYATPIWAMAHKTTLDRLDIKQTKYFTNRRKYTRKEEVLTTFQLENPKSRRLNLTKNFYDKIENNTNPTLREMKERKPTQGF